MTAGLYVLSVASVAAQGAPLLSPQQIEQGLKRYAHEPRVEEVIEKALHKIAVDPQRTKRLAEKARLAGWVPQLRLGARRTYGQSDTLNTSDTWSTSLYNNDSLALGASLFFRFDRVVFSGQEPGLLREERAMRQHRAEVVRTVVHLYYERRRLQLERDLLHKTDVEHTVHLLEVEALLNSFTDGLLQRKR